MMAGYERSASLLGGDQHYCPLPLEVFFFLPAPPALAE